CEAIMPLIDGDFAELLNAVATGRLDQADPRLTGKHAVTVIVAARGYPGTPASGGLIREIEAAEQVEGVTVFHAGTALEQRGLIAGRHGALDAAERITRSVGCDALEALHYYEMSKVTAHLHRGPLTRRLILAGPADDFQTSELVRLFSQLPGVSQAQWTEEPAG